jgi:hypothetical protein
MNRIVHEYCPIGKGGPPAAWQGPDKNLQQAIEKGKMTFNPSQT